MCNSLALRFVLRAEHGECNLQQNVLARLTSRVHVDLVCTSVYMYLINVARTSGDHVFRVPGPENLFCIYLKRIFASVEKTLFS